MCVLPACLVGHQAWVLEVLGSHLGYNSRRSRPACSVPAAFQAALRVLSLLQVWWSFVSESLIFPNQFFFLSFFSPILI